jgi:uncharacterized membrane protein YfcA
MHALLLPIIECILISLAAGMIFGIFGSGSGLIMTPGYYYILRHFNWAHDHRMQMAIATTAMASGVLGFFSARVQIKKKNTDNHGIKQMSLGLFIGAVTAILLATLIPSEVLKKAFGIVVILVSIWLWQYKNDKDDKAWSLDGFPNLIRSFLIGLIWFLLGVAVFLAPYLLKCRIDMRKAIGSASVLAGAFSLIAALLFMLIGYFVIGISWMHIGYVNLLISLCAVIPGALGGYFGSHISVRLPQTHLKQIYACLVFVVGILMVV